MIQWIATVPAMIQRELLIGLYNHRAETKLGWPMIVKSVVKVSSKHGILFGKIWSWGNFCLPLLHKMTSHPEATALAIQSRFRQRFPPLVSLGRVCCQRNAQKDAAWDQWLPFHSRVKKTPNRGHAGMIHKYGTSKNWMMERIAKFIRFSLLHLCSSSENPL